MPCSRLTILTAALAAAVVLTGCGGGQAEPDEGKESGAAASAEARPDLGLPDDVELSFASDAPSGARHAAALTDAENYLRALAHGIVAQDPEDDAYRFYSEGQGARYAEEQIQQWVDGEWTATGKDRYYRTETADVGDSKGVLVTMCRNQAGYFGKNVRTGEVERTGESLKSYQKFSLLMRPAKGGEPHWAVQRIEVQGEAKECRR